MLCVESGDETSLPGIPSEDNYGNLVRNLEKYHLSEYVTLKKGYSNQQDIRDFIGQKAEDVGIGLLFIDSDGYVGRDVNQYAPLLNDNCILVFDDYSSVYAPEKAEQVEQWVKQAESTGRVTSLGVYGWGTWIGLYHKDKVRDGSD